MSSILRKSNVCAVIPFFNEEKTINEIVGRTLNFVDLVICVDDGSTDSSVNRISINEKIILFKNDINKGKGYALKRGFEKSMEMNTNLTITLDADLQHPPEFIPSFIECLKTSDIAIGNRLNDLSTMPFQRIMSNKITSKLLSIKTKRNILDSQCGFRGFRTGILNLILPSYNGYEAESEMLVKAARNNLRISFINIPAIYGEEKSKIQPFQTIKGFTKVFFS